MATLGVTSSIDTALRRAFSEASVRVAPETKISDIVTALGAMGIAVEIEDGVLLLKQDQTSFNTSLALRNFSKRAEHAKFFILETSDPKTWDTQKKMAFLRTHTAAEYGKLCSGPVLEAGIKTMDPNMSRADYRNLTTQERIAFIREYGDDPVRRIMLKAK